MLKQLRNNKKGIVFVTVLMVIIVTMVLVISLISFQVTSVMSNEAEVLRIKAELLAFGMLAYTFANQSSNTASNYISSIYTLDNTVFNVTSVVGPPGSGISGTSNLVINVTY